MGQEKIDHKEESILEIIDCIEEVIFCIGEDGEACGPVSDFSTIFFGENIEGKNVIDFFYRDLTSEEIKSQIRSAIVITLGADSIQWNAVKNHLPEEVSIKVKGQIKNLLVSYSPLFDKEDNLEKIIVSAKDLTSYLDQKQLEIKENKEIAMEVEILKELTSISEKDLNQFFSTALSLLDQITEELKKEKGDMVQVLRDFHTLKGNSRIAGLFRISEKVHELESSTLEIVGDLKEIDLETASLLRELIKEIDTFIHYYSRSAEKILKIDNIFRPQLIDEAHKKIISLDNIFASILNSKLTDFSIISQIITDLIDDLKSLFERLGDDYLIQKCENSLDLLSIKEEKYFDLSELKKYIFSILRGSRDRYIGSKFFHHYSRKESDWIPLIKKLFEVQILLDQLNDPKQGEPKADHKHTLDVLQNLWSEVESRNLLFLEKEVKELESYVFNWDLSKEHVPEKLNIIWNYISLVLFINLNDNLDREIRVKNFLALSKIDPEKDNLNYIFGTLFTQEVIFFSCLKIFSKDPKEFQSFINLISKSVEAKSLKELFERFFNLEDNIYDIPNIFNKLKFEGFGPKENGFEDGPKCSEAFMRVFKSIWFKKDMVSQYLLNLDLIQLFGSYNHSEETIQQGAAKTIEIVDINFNKLLHFLETNKEIPDVKEFQRSLEIFISRLPEVPLKSTFGRYFSMVRDVGKRLGKKVRLRILGPDLTFKEEKISILHDAITHLIRNGLDHGIEPPEERIKSGKSETGTLDIVLIDEPERVIITIKDDGRGMNSGAIAKKAIDQGLTQPSDLRGKSSEDIFQFIFEPSFSTKEEVTDLSGRGIGMDVVKANVESIGGEIKIKSKFGKGSSIELIFPHLPSP